MTTIKYFESSEERNKFIEENFAGQVVNIKIGGLGTKECPLFIEYIEK